jgi:hypothetical protein
MAKINHLPRVRGIQAAVGKHDPMHNSLFEVSIVAPDMLKAAYSDGYSMYISQAVKTVGGLDALQKTTTAGSQRFLGADVSFLNPVLDQTYAEITIEFNLNLTDSHESKVFNFFKAWQYYANYDLRNGLRSLKADYLSDEISISEANRDGTIWRAYKFYNVMLTGVTGLDSLDYTSNEPRSLQVTFRADYWDEWFFPQISGNAAPENAIGSDGDSIVGTDGTRTPMNLGK